MPGSPEVTYDPVSQVVTRAAIWGVCEVATPDTSAKIAALAARWMRKGQEGVTLTMVSIRALGRIGTREAAADLQRLAQKTKNKPLLRAIEQALERVASAQGVDRGTLDGVAADSLGLDTEGRRTWHMGEHVGETSLTPRGRVEVCYRNTRTGRTSSSPPKGLKDAYAAELVEMRETAKRVRERLTFEAARLEEAMTGGRAWAVRDWEGVYGAQPILRNLQRFSR